ncbi:MAG: glycosyltransferase family 2 protein, partial [Candidatus Omnitrophica bacterium]|nr:glycosyltransferase family 2 protein [Candidatus Omnitrophota bacterium]
VLSYYRLKTREKTDWMQKIQDLPFPSQDIYHVVIFPTIKESRDILEPGIQSVLSQTFPTDRTILLLAIEERASLEIHQAMISLKKDYASHFFHFENVIHPANLPGEAKVKGANVTYAARYAAGFLRQKGIPYENVLVSCFDSDTIISPQYLACLTYTFMVTPNRIQASFQPIPVYHNNIWDVPGFARVIETGSSFFLLMEATNPEKLVTFSSHSMSFKALVDVGYWPVDMISDDSAIYWKAFIHYDGNYQVVPMYVTVSMDVAGCNNFKQTAISVYKQKRRWAWGVENFPVVMRAFIKSSQISLFDKIRYSFRLFEGQISWATWGLLLSFISWLPVLMAGQDFLGSVLYYTAPRITRTILHLASIALIISIILNIGLLPSKRPHHTLLKRIGLALEWLAIPIIVVIFGSLPALDAQTRLMLGKHMEFWVTDKKRTTV